MRLFFPHSPAFPGGGVRVEEAEATEAKCIVEFGDGATMIGDWRPDHHAIVLDGPSLSYSQVRGG